MNIEAQNHTWGEHISSIISCFLEEFHVGNILKSFNAYKVRGFSVTSVFQVAYRFINSSCVNWHKLTMQLGKVVIQEILLRTSESWRNVLIIDDSLFIRARSENVELLAKVFDHVEHEYTRGFHMLTLGWSNGN